MSSHFQSLHFSSPRKDDDPERARDEAARRIQQVWRVHSGDKSKAKYLTPHARWQDAMTNAQLEVTNMGAQDGNNQARARWRRAGVMAKRLQDGNEMLQNAGVSAPDATRKKLETQHWLELVDGKHRYGSNLKFYHKKWKDADTSENLFKWLDHGGGKDVSLKECPRDQLEKEVRPPAPSSWTDFDESVLKRIAYLSSEQRLNYLVEIDSEGKLRWTRNKQLVDTTAGHWKDAGNGQGIVPQDDPDVPNQPRTNNTALSPSSSVSASSNSLNNAALHYVGPAQGKSKLTRAFWSRLTVHGMIERLLRKTVKRNTWIYVSDKNFNIFVGIKDPGTFQHSSFLAGGLVTSAGLISVKDGVIHTLSPLSGHYRTSINHFRRFLQVLEERGVDMDKVEVSKAVSMLWLIERLAKFKKAQSRFTAKGRAKIHKTKEDIENLPQTLTDTSWKKDILEGRKRRTDGQKEEAEEKENQDGLGAERTEHRDRVKDTPEQNGSGKTKSPNAEEHPPRFKDSDERAAGDVSESPREPAHLPQQEIQEN